MKRGILNLALIVVGAMALRPCFADGIYTYLDSSGRRVFTNVDPQSTAILQGAIPPDKRTAALRINHPLASPSSLEFSGPLRDKINSLIQKYDFERFHLGPEFVQAVIKVESNFNPNAVSRKGALGLMQLMPATARRFGVRNVFDPEQNLEGGMQYLKFLLETFKGDPNLTLAAYNAGENVVQRLKSIPPYRETREYVRRVSQILGNSNPIPLYNNSQKRLTYVARVGGKLKFTNVDPPPSAVVFDGYNMPHLAGTP